MALKQQDVSRSELVRKRRQQQSNKRLTQSLARASQPTINRPMVKKAKPGIQKRTGRNSRNQQYNAAFTIGSASVRTPALRLPQIGVRWFSALLTAVLVYGLYFFLTSPYFLINRVETSGNVRFSPEEISTKPGLIGHSIFEIIPTEITMALLTGYHGLSNVDVDVMLPNRVKVTVTEREPLISWQLEGSLTWIDAEGVAFEPRGEPVELIPVIANTPPPIVQQPEDKPWITTLYLDQHMIQAITSLYPYLPSGSSMIYDAQYGFGWQDEGGWTVYFGENTDDLSMKLLAYQAIVDQLANRGIQPVMISMEYLAHPFYKAQP